jgi:hypothetical protein
MLNGTVCTHMVGGLAASLLAAAASGQVLVNEGFENGAAGWTVNGSTETYPDGNPGQYLGIPYLDFWGVTLRTEEVGAVLGDLRRYPGGLRIRVDIRVFALDNFFGDPMDPANFPVVLELVNRAGDQVSVYTTGPGMPPVSEGWTEYEFVIPNPTQAALPPGWGGTGDEDPQTFEPRLPPGVTYAQVLSQVDEFRLTTMRPGYFYAASFWQAGFDNLRIEHLGAPPCPADADGNGQIQPADVATFVNTWFASVSAGTLAGDFDGDGHVTPADVAAFVNAWFAALSNGC